MPPIDAVFIVIGGALFLTGLVLALRYRRQGGVEVRSRKWYLTVLLTSVSTALVTVAAVHAWVLPALGIA